MERLILAHIIEWYGSKDRKPLLICGARQVGKTYLLREQFAKRFKNSVYIDLLKDGDSRRFFSSTCDPEKYLEYIEARFNRKVSPECPLILDEVQECPMAIVSLKYFCQDHRDLPVIATGSLIRVAINRMKRKEEFSFPVGKVNVMNMYPMTFEEYLLNANPALLRTIRESYSSHRPMDSAFHEMALDRLYEYLAIGGMPEVVDRFIKTHSYVDAGKTISDVYGNYLADMSMYNVSDETILKTRNIYRNIFVQLNKGNKNFKIGRVEHGKSNRDYSNAYMWLELSRVVYRSRKTEGRIPLPLREEEQGLFRYYLADQGMFVHQSRLPYSDFLVRDKRNTLAGIFYENYVAVELRAKGIELFYWTGKGSHEVEFVVQDGQYAVPIDVKKTAGKMGSLEAFRSSNPRYTAVKISAGNYGYDPGTDILSIPLYQTFLLAEQLSKGESIRPERINGTFLANGTGHRRGSFQKRESPDHGELPPTSVQRDPPETVEEVCGQQPEAQHDVVINHGIILRRYADRVHHHEERYRGYRCDPGGYPEEEGRTDGDQCDHHQDIDDHVASEGSVYPGEDPVRDVEDER